MGRGGAESIRVVVHDYSGHPFQVQLSRELARRGYEVLHLHCSSYVTGRGAVVRREDDPPTFDAGDVPLDRQFAKYSPWTRLRQEHEYARRLLARIDAFDPDVVISSNTPLFAQQRLLPGIASRRRRFVFWQQDVYSVAMGQTVRARLPVIGAPLARWFASIERRLLHASDAVVTISDDFRPILEGWGVPGEKLFVIENWAPLEELPAAPRDNEWARERGLTDARVVLYSGTLGLKHDPALLLALAAALADDGDVRVVVVSEGRGADWLAEESRRQRIESLVVLPFQPYERLPEVHASADVLSVILERDAGVFSVPSKALSYHCAGRPLLAAVPAENHAARLIARHGSGLVVDPGDTAAFIAAARHLLDDPELRSMLGDRARRFAEETFDIQSVADRFEDVLAFVGARRSGSRTERGAPAR